MYMYMFRAKRMKCILERNFFVFVLELVKKSTKLLSPVLRQQQWQGIAVS